MGVDRTAGSGIVADAIITVTFDDVPVNATAFDIFFVDETAQGETVY